MATTAITNEYRAPKILPFGKKARTFARRYPSLDRRITILEGSVRSSKTWAMLAKFPSLCHYKVDGHRVITGVSKQTIYQNVLSDIFDVLGPSNYNYNRQTGELDIMGVKWLVIGAKDEGSEKYVRGMTIGLLYADELVLQPRSFVMMAMNRLSPKGARMYATTNPDSPYHYVKTEIIDNKALRDAGDLEVLHFTLDDNPNLTEDYKAFVKRAYVGVYYQRFILGLWVVAEGAIYGSCWSEALCYDGPCPINTETAEQTIAIDCGVGHPQVYLQIFDNGTDVYVDREYVWESVATMRQKTDGQYADDLEDFMDGGNKAGMPGVKSPGALVVIPPECASFEAELVARGIWHTDADNDVTEGIKMTSSMMALRNIHFSRERCPKTISKLPAYAWDPKKALRGIEEPIKQMDDECDAVRYFVKTRISPYRIAGQAA